MHGQPTIKIFSKHIEDNLIEIDYYEKVCTFLVFFNT